MIRTMRRRAFPQFGEWRWAVGLAVVTACGPRVGVSENEGETAEGTSEAVTSESGPIDPPPPSTTGVVSTTGTDGGEASSEDGATTAGFIDRPDFACFSICGFECDPWAQDCPQGEKCAGWANDGGNAWNAFRCSPVGRNPGQPGDPCTVDGSPVSGIDSCDVWSMCWNVDPETNTGTCIETCKGSEANPSCTTGECMVGSGLLVCVPSCDPLQPACVDGFVCAPVGAAFGCIPDADPEAGVIEPWGNCNDAGLCPGGTACVWADTTSLCDQGQCCSPLCDLGSAEPDFPCTAPDVCRPFFDQGQGDPNVGICGAP